MVTLGLLLLMSIPLIVAWGAGYLLGKDVMNMRNEEARWNAFDIALGAHSDEAWDVYYAAYPRETK